MFGGRSTSSIAFRSLSQDEQDNCLLLELFFCLHVGIYGPAHKPILQRDLKLSGFFSGHDIAGLFLDSLETKRFNR